MTGLLRQDDGTALAGPRVDHQITFGVLAVAVVAYALLQSLVVPILSTLQLDLHTSQDAVTWVLTAYLLAASIFTPIMGRLGDMIGKQRVFVATMVALSAGSLLAALATNVTVMIVARVIQGIGGGVLPVAFGIIRDEFPKEKISGAVGALASLAALGTGAGIMLAGPIVDVLDYHWLFWAPMIFTVAAAVAAHFVIPESPTRATGRISWLPAMLLSAWLLSVLIAFSEAPNWGWVSGRVIGLLAAAVVLMVAWVAAEQRVLTPLIDMTMMRRPAVWTNNLVALLLGFGMYGVFAFVPEFVQTAKSSGYGFGASLTESGLIMLPSAVCQFLASLYAGRFAKFIGGKATVVLGCVISVVSLLILAFAHHAKWELFLSTAILGVGFGLAYPAMTSLVVNAVPPEQTGVAAGMNTNIRSIGGSMGAALMASIVTAQVGPSGLPKEIGYTTGFVMLAGSLALAVLAALAIPVPALQAEALTP